MERSQELLDLNQRMNSGDLRDTPADQQVSTTAAVSVFGTDPTEWWTDRATIVQMLDAQRQAMGQGVQNIPTIPRRGRRAIWAG